MKRMLFVFAILLSVVMPSFAAEFQCGQASADITPPVPYRLRGYFSERPSTAIHDPLNAKAIVFRQGNVQAALVMLDLTAVPRSITDVVRRDASKATGIPVEAIIVAATHSHTAPLFNNSVRDYLHNQAVKKYGKDKLEEFDYPKYLIENATKAIVQAHAALKTSDLGFMSIEAPPVAFNRRYFMKNSTDVKCNPGIKNPNVIKPAGPIDPRLSVLFISDSGSKTPKASLTNFALHLDTTGGTLVSADYPFYLEEVLKNKYGEKFLSIFGNGTCGDINHFDVSGKNPRRKAPEIGQLLGDAIAAAADKETKPLTTSLATACKVAVCPQVAFTEEETKEAFAHQGEMLSGANKKLTLAERMKIEKATMMAGTPRNLSFDIVAIRLSNDTGLVAIPGEIFVESGLAIKKASPFRNTIVIELSQDDVGYIP
ncbi:MAG: neutral/alkaline non-lysosomal ceramidase N-terminal domain-containing protein, partial [Planctomycetia bacterium]|nr:neutral/alkaline non-lysosomal ceramidase N-terminal domain-containing protein [Planctomycetia bacterium]